MFDGPVTIAHAIQLAVTPVFLVTGIGAMLAVLTNRLARIIDRARSLQTGRPRSADAQVALDRELGMLARRARLVHGAIALCTGSALFISSVIAVIFLSFFFAVKLATLIAVLFVAATISFILALLLFLREVQLATHSLRLHSLQMAPEFSAPPAGPGQPGV